MEWIMVDFILLANMGQQYAVWFDDRLSKPQNVWAKLRYLARPTLESIGESNIHHCDLSASICLARVNSTYVTQCALLR